MITSCKAWDGHRWDSGAEPQAWHDQYDLILSSVVRISKAVYGRMNGSLTKSGVEIVLDHFSKEEFGVAVEGLSPGVYSMGDRQQSYSVAL